MLIHLASTTVSETETSQVTAEPSSIDIVTEKVSEMKIEEPHAAHVDQVTQVDTAAVTQPEKDILIERTTVQVEQVEQEDDVEEEDEIQFNAKDDYEEDDEEEEDEDDEDDEDDADSEDDDDVTESFDYDSEDDDKLLLEDMLIMSDYIENVDGQVEDLNELLAWSQMQNGNEELLLDSEFSYSDLDTPQVNKGKKKKSRMTDFEEEEEFILRDSEAFMDPEIFQQTMRNALSEVPPSLKPGMRKWFEKQQKKEQRKQKKEEEKARRKKEQAKALKGKKNKYSESDLSTHMTRIDE
jgi:hypothetical protein